MVMESFVCNDCCVWSVLDMMSFDTVFSCNNNHIIHVCLKIKDIILHYITLLETFF